MVWATDTYRKRGPLIGSLRRSCKFSHEGVYLGVADLHAALAEYVCNACTQVGTLLGSEEQRGTATDDCTAYKG